MRAAAIITSAWLTLSLFLFSVGYSPASADVAYYGILRGFESEGVNSIAGFDIAADESGIYIVGEFFKAPGYGPMVLFLNPDHSFRCQKVLEFTVNSDPGIRSGGYSIALNASHVIVAGVYGDVSVRWYVARLFVAVFHKATCEYTGLREWIDSDLEWVNIYNIFLGGIKVVWDDGRDSMYVMLSTIGTHLVEERLYLLQLNSTLHITAGAEFEGISQELFLFFDMDTDSDSLHLVGVRDSKGLPIPFYATVSKDDFSRLYLYDVGYTFPDFEVFVGNAFMSRLVLSSLYERTFVNIALSFACSGRDCSEDGNPAVRLGLIRFPLGVRIPRLDVRLYDWETTHWNKPAPYNHRNNTWVTRIVEAGDMFYMVGLLGSSPDSAEDGFVYAVDAQTLNAQYMLRVVSLDQNPSDGGRRVLSAVLGAGSYNGYAYITGTAGNYYLEFTPFNPSNITGTGELDGPYVFTSVEPELRSLNNFFWAYDSTPGFDLDIHPTTAGFYGVLRLNPATTTTSTVTSTSTTTLFSTVTTTPTTTVTRFTTSTQTAVATRFETEYVFSTVYTTRVVEGTVTRYDTVTSVTTIPIYTTFVDTTTLRVTATTTPTVYATVQTTVNRTQTQTVRQTTTEVVAADGYVPWPLLLLPFIPLLLLPPFVVANGRRLTIAILEGASERLPESRPASMLGEYFKPSVGKLRRNGKVTFHNKDRATHELELYSPELPDRQKVFTLKPGEKVRVKMKEPGRYFFRLTAKPEKIGVLEVD